MSAVGALRLLLTTLLVRWSRRRLAPLHEHRAFPFVVPAACVVSLAAALLQRLAGRRLGPVVPRVARRLSTAVGTLSLHVGFPVTLAAAFRASAEADWVAMVGIFLGTLLGHRQASVMLLLMVTGGEVLEDYALSTAGEAVGALMGWKARAPQRVASLVSADADGAAPGAGAGHAGGPARSARGPKVLQVRDIKEVCRGDLIVVRVGEVIPIDGTVRAVRGDGAGPCPAGQGLPEGSGAAVLLACWVQETALTGEMQPVHKAVGDTVLSGTVLHDCRSRTRVGTAQDSTPDDAAQLASLAVNNSVVIEASCRVDECTSAMVSASWEAALRTQGNKAKFERLSSRYAALFTPFTFLVASAAGLLMTPQPRAGHALRQRLERVVCVLMAATPCPLSIGVPIAFIGAMSAAAKLGITFKRAAAVEKLAAATTVVLDKTGTLTHAEMQVKTCIVHADAVTSRDLGCVPRLLAGVRAAEADSTHIVGKCLFEFSSKASETDVIFATGPARARVVATGPVEAQGVESTSNGQRFLVGSLAFVCARTAATVVLHDCGDVTASALTPNSPAAMHVFVVVDDEHVATFVLSNDVRSGALPLLTDLHQRHRMQISVLSGDTTENVMRLLHRVLASDVGGASTLQVNDISVVGGCLPHDKVAYIEDLKKLGEVVVMVGDGLNDAAALTAADVGIAVGSSAHGLTTESADAVLLSQDLRVIAASIAISQNAVNCAHGVVRFGMGSSLVQMAAAAAGLLPPFVNSVLQEVVDLSAIVKALTVLSFNPNAASSGK